MTSCRLSRIVCGGEKSRKMRERRRGSLRTVTGLSFFQSISARECRGSASRVKSDKTKGGKKGERRAREVVSFGGVVEEDLT